MSQTPDQVIPFARMTEAQYDQERARIRDLPVESKQVQLTHKDQALARLFVRSGWTQEQLAAKEGCSQQLVDCRTRFGRFLDFTTAVVTRDRPIAWHTFVWDATRHDWRPGVQLRFLPGRLRFRGAAAGAPFPSAIVVFDPQQRG